MGASFPVLTRDYRDQTVPEKTKNKKLFKFTINGDRLMGLCKDIMDMNVQNLPLLFATGLLKSKSAKNVIIALTSYPVEELDTLMHFGHRICLKFVP